MKFQLSKRIPEGHKRPLGYGSVYYDAPMREFVCYPWGIHWLVWGWRFVVEKLSQTPPLPSDETWRKRLLAEYNRGAGDERQRIVSALKAAGLDDKNSSVVLSLQVIENLDRQGIATDFGTVHGLATVAMQNSPLYSDNAALKRKLAAEFERGHKIGYGKGYGVAKHDLNSVLDKVVSEYIVGKMREEIAAGRVFMSEQGGDSNSSQSNSSNGHSGFGDTH